MDARRNKRGRSLYKGTLYSVPLRIILALFIVMMFGECGYLKF